MSTSGDRAAGPGSAGGPADAADAAEAAGAAEPTEPTEPTAKATAGGGFSQSLERGLLILSAFTEHRPVLGIADLARAAGLTKSTAHRYVATLAKLGYVLQDPDTRKYSLGPRVIDLGFAALNSMEITRIAAQPLQALSDETGYPASMAVLDGADVVYVDRRRSRRATGFPMDITLHVGSRLPAYCTSMGKVLLADRDPEQLAALLERSEFTRRGPKTITSRKRLLAVLDQVRKSGIAVNDEELAPGLRSVAAPVRDRTGAVVAAVNLAVHLTTWNAPVETVVVRLEGPLRATANEISARLGWRPERW